MTPYLEKIVYGKPKSGPEVRYAVTYWKGTVKTVAPLEALKNGSLLNKVKQT